VEEGSPGEPLMPVLGVLEDDLDIGK